MKCENTLHMLLFSSITTTSDIILSYKVKKSLPVEYIIFHEFSLSNCPYVLWMQHKIHDCDKIPSLTWGVGNAFCTEICTASRAVFLYDIYGAPVKHFFHWCYLIIQSLLGENVGWFSTLLRTRTKKTVTQNFLCRREKSNHSHDFISGAVHSFRARWWDTPLQS